MEVDACDDSSSDHVTITLGVCGMPGSGCTSYFQAVTTDADTPGCDVFFVDLSSQNITIDNGSNSYYAEVFLNPITADINTRFRRFTVYYQLQMSPAQATPTFSDVPPTHPFYQAIEALAASGITQGCGSGKYCPDNAVIWGQMAAFLA